MHLNRVSLKWETQFWIFNVHNTTQNKLQLVLYNIPVH